MLTSLEIAELAVKALDSKKAKDIKVLETRDVTVLADYFILCTAGSTTQIKTLTDEVHKLLEENGEPPLRTEGYRRGGWVLIDFGCAVVHIFLKDIREFYALERLWRDAREVDIAAWLDEDQMSKVQRTGLMKYEFALSRKSGRTNGKRQARSARKTVMRAKVLRPDRISVSVRRRSARGHPRPYTAMDIVVRKRRMQGQNVLFPIGCDACGLPTENYAIKNKIHPAVGTKRNIARFTEQLKMLGYSFDWDRVVDTTDPKYYKWTQWIFLKLFERGLAYKASIPVNWCTSCRCVLANEEVVNGVCERCGADVVRREKSQWMLKITEYAQRLIDDLDGLDFIERVKIQQINWIGRSTGAEVDFQTTSDTEGVTTAGDTLRVFTTRPDTLFGATYMVMSPEHAFLKKWSAILTNSDEVRAYQETAAKKSDFERTEIVREKTGVELKGVRAVNPVTGEEIPIYIRLRPLRRTAPGRLWPSRHDTRDWSFAKKSACRL
jgi:ribosome silencing factor RsfS/YbeB/iojap